MAKTFNLFPGLQMLKDLLQYLPPIHKEGFLFIAIFFIASIGLFFVSNSLGWIGIILTIWCVCFFRDPHRIAPLTQEAVVSPADGRIDNITKVKPPKELEMGEEELTRVSIFLSVFDVHVNRIPISGTIKKLYYHPGKFISATLDKASDLNERQSVLIETDNGKQIAIVQIAGLIARRIVCDLDENQSVKSGERFGIIRFGSRVDVFLPKGIEPKVVVGQYMIGGETIIAELIGKQHKVHGELR
ncbi:MAG: phosphatidylserine decarboxylase [Candidatus Midichloriaceae bacterium]|jgi:phosphatidylserine decarboxylase|nr:phosphatidylserine decarboxylase [Candidatus Midichloriaceae bacterium]